MSSGYKGCCLSTNFVLLDEAALSKSIRIKQVRLTLQSRNAGLLFHMNIATEVAGVQYIFHSVSAIGKLSVLVTMFFL